MGGVRIAKRDGVRKGQPSPLTQERLWQVLHYDPETGVFHRLRKDGSLGRVAGTLDETNGYIKIMVDKVIYRAHRLAFLYVDGKLPPNDVDHKNRTKSDNRWSNLRHATHQENMHNKPAHTAKILQFKAVRDHEDGRYSSKISVMGTTLHLGIYNTPEEANAAYAGAARVIYGDFAAAA